MPHRKRHNKITAMHHRDSHRHLLTAVLTLCGIVLIVNAWLVSQQIVTF